MEFKFKEDENGKIHDSDAIFEKIDEQLDNEEYEAVVSKILAIPRKKWSNKLRFKLICAYSNQKDFEKSERELDEIQPLCETNEDRARYLYMRGYIFYMSDREILARQNYRAAMQFDPEYAKSIDLESEITDCSEIITEDLARLRALFDKIAADVRTYCAKDPQKLKLSDEEFQMRLGFFPGIRRIPGFKNAVGFKNFDFKYNREDREKCRLWMSRFYGITDKESFFKFIQRDMNCNVSQMASDAAAYLAGKPHFDVSELNEVGKFAFGNTVEFVRQLVGCLPKAGALAWDICEKIGFARHAYYSGMIEKNDYCTGMKGLSDTAKANFSGWEEYIRSLLCGAALYMFGVGDWSISEAVKFAENMTGLVLKSDLGSLSWNG